MTKFKFILLSALPTISFLVFLFAETLGIGSRSGLKSGILIFYLFIGLVILQLCFLLSAWFFVRRPGNEYLKRTLARLFLFLVLLIGYPILGDFFMEGLWFIPVGGVVILVSLYFLFKKGLKHPDNS